AIAAPAPASAVTTASANTTFTRMDLTPSSSSGLGRNRCGRNGHLQDGLERSAALGDAAERRSARAHGIEQPPLEDDPHGLPVAEEREVAHAEPCELRDL